MTKIDADLREGGIGKKCLHAPRTAELSVLPLEPFSLKQREKIALQYDLNHGNMNVSFAANGFFKKAKAFMENIPFKEKKK